MSAGGAGGRRRSGGTAAEREGRRRAREERRAAQVAQAPHEVARELCLQLLTARPRAAAELRTACEARGVPPEVAAQVVARLGEVGLVDDEAFAAAFVESRHRSRGLSRRALEAELRRRGVEGRGGGRGGRGRRRRPGGGGPRAGWRVRGWPRAGAERPEVRVRRAAAAVARRGYAPGLAYRVVREELAAAGDLPGDDVGAAGG